MTKVLALQILGLVLGFIFVYWGIRTIFSKKYFIENWNKNNPDKKTDYEHLELEHKVYVRFGWGGRWLLFGLGLLALVVYSFIKL